MDERAKIVVNEALFAWLFSFLRALRLGATAVFQPRHLGFRHTQLGHIRTEWPGKNFRPEFDGAVFSTLFFPTLDQPGLIEPGFIRPESIAAKPFNIEFVSAGRCCP